MRESLNNLPDDLLERYAIAEVVKSQVSSSDCSLASSNIGDQLMHAGRDSIDIIVVDSEARLNDYDEQDCL